MSTGLIVFLAVLGTVACIALAVSSIADTVRLVIWLEDKPGVTFKEFLRACFLGVPVRPAAPKVIYEGSLIRFEVLTVPATPVGDCSALCSSDFTFTRLVFADGKEIVLPGQYQPEVGGLFRVVDVEGKYLLEECAPPKQ
jgi:hypothetical protein